MSRYYNTTAVHTRATQHETDEDYVSSEKR
jgi:hypothetical protein